MKKIIAYILVGILCLAAIGGLIYGLTYDKGNTKPVDEIVQEDELSSEEALKKAEEYLKTIYREVEKETPRDYERIGVVPIGKFKFQVTWSVDVSEEYVKIVVNENGMVTIDVNEECGEDIPYVLTATIKDEKGNIRKLTWEHVIPKKITGTYQEIVDMAYALKPGESLPNVATLQGTVTTINTPWDSGYKNITVTIVVEGREDKPIQCYRLKSGEADASQIEKGDLITVTGILKNYNGTIEFDAGCTLDANEKGAGTILKVSGTMQEIVDKAYALKDGESLKGEATLTGTVTAINTAWNDQYKNISVTIAVEGREDKPIQCYRLKSGAADASKIEKGDLITVTGILKNFKGTIEFDAGCTLDKNEKGKGTILKVSGTMQEIVDKAYALKDGEVLKGEATLTGTVTAINTAWSADFKNISVTIVVEGREDKPIQCYRMKSGAADASKVAKGDLITVTGLLKNFKGTIEFDAGCTLDANKKGAGTIETVSGTYQEIVDKAYALKEGEVLKGEATLQGTVTAIGTEWSDQYKNITVTIAVEGREDKPIECYRLKSGAADASKIEKGDLITVTGMLKNYNGKIEFDAGCTLDANKKGAGTINTVTGTMQEIVDKAYALKEGTALEGEATLTGSVIKINTPYSDQYNNVTVTIVVDGREDKPIECYRLKGTNVENVAVGDKITVVGILKNFYGKIEFDQGCEMTDWVKGGGSYVPDEPDEPDVPDVPVLPEVSLEDGDQVVIYAPAYGKALSATKTGNYNVGVDVTITDGVMSGYDAASTWTVIVNDDGTYSFANGGQNIGLAAEYTSMNLGAEHDTWELIDLGDGLYNLKNVGRETYMEWYARYSNWSTYGASNAATDDQFQLAFYVISGEPENPDEPDEPDVPDVPVVPSAPFEDGDQIVIYAPAYNKALSATKTGNYNVGVDVTITDGVMSGYDAASTWTVIVNDDGTYSFANGGQNIGLASQYTSMNLGTEHDTWELIDLGNGLYNLKNVGRETYMEWYARYSNWSTYGASNAATDDQFQLAFYNITQEEEKITLEDARDYLIELYANESTITNSDYTRVTLLTIEGTEFKVTWSVNVSEEDVRVYHMSGSEYSNIDVNEDTTEEINYTLTATIVSADDLDGESITTSWDYVVEAQEADAVLNNGDQVVIYAPAYNKALSATKTGNYNVGVDVTITDGVMSGYDAASTWTVIVNDDGTYSFANGGQNIGLASQYTSMNLGTEHDTWELIDLGDGLYNLKNVGRETYMEWYARYSNWSTYGASNAATDDQFQLAFYVISGETENPDEPDEPDVPDVPVVPEISLENGAKIVIYAPAYNKALSATKTGNYNVGVDVTITDGVMSGYDETSVWTVIVNADGTYSFENNGQNIGLASQYTSMNLGAEHDTWELIDLGDGLYNLKNVGRETYMEWYARYSNWSTYGASNAATDDQFQLSFYIVEPAPVLQDGDQVVIYAPAYNKALSATKTGNYNVGVDVTITDGVMTGYDAASTWTVIVNDDGTYSFANGGQNIGLASQYTSMNLGAENDTWELIELEDGLYNLKNVGRETYMEWYARYSNWSTYGASNAATDDQFQLLFYKVTE